MKRNVFLILFLSLSLTLVNVGQGQASEVLPLSFQQVTASAELIFEGRVLSRTSRLSPSSGNPFTYFTFQILDILKGSYPGRSIELGFMGGPKGGYVMRVTDMRMPKIGEKGIYFVERLDVQQVHPLCGWHQGHYLVISSPYNSQERVVPVRTDPSALTVAPTLNEFKQSVRNIVRGLP